MYLIRLICDFFPTPSSDPCDPPPPPAAAAPACAPAAVCHTSAYDASKVTCDQITSAKTQLFQAAGVTLLGGLCEYRPGLVWATCVQRCAPAELGVVWSCAGQTIWVGGQSPPSVTGHDQVQLGSCRVWTLHIVLRFLAHSAMCAHSAHVCCVLHHYLVGVAMTTISQQQPKPMRQAPGYLVHQAVYTHVAIICN